MDDAERKKRFAYQILLEPDEPYKAGLAAYPEKDNYHNHMAMVVAQDWLNDVDIHLLKRQLIAEHGEDFFLPTKQDLAREIWKTAKNGKTSEKLAAQRLYAEVRGFIEKPVAAQINNTVSNTTNKVMVVPARTSDADWEDAVAAQQAKLVSAA